MARVKILVVEDEAITAKDLQNMLKELGYDAPAIASSGEGAIKTAEEIEPDVVLMDIVLKGDMDGIEAAEHIRDRFDIPVVYATACMDEERLEKTKVTEPYGYIIKPFEDTGLRVAIEMALQRHKQDKALRESETRFRELFDNMSSGVAVYEAKEGGTDFVFKDFNHAAETMDRIKKEDLLGRSVLEVFPGVIDFGLFEVFQRVWNTGKQEYSPISFYKDERIIGWRANYVYKLPSGEIVAVYDDVTERKQAEEALRNAEAYWRTSFNSLDDVMLIIDRDYNIEKINEIGLKLLGKSKEEVIGKKCYQVISGADSPGEECPCMKSLETKKVESLDWYEERFGRYYSIKSSPIFDENGELIKFVDLRRDITERKQAGDKIRASLKEKEMLLREIHHRVKNNLQVVSSLLTMQARATKNKNVKDILSESRNRINAMALIHSQLYEGGNLSEINMKGFMDKLMVQLLQIHLVPDRKITPIVHAVECSLPISIAVPVGLIVNELLTNAFKHAFVNRKEGKIEVSLGASGNGAVNLKVSDDGVGLPEGFDINTSKTLGLHVVKLLVEEQLDGKLEVVSDKGATFKVEFEMAEG